METYSTVSEIQRASLNAGSFFFSPDTMKWFKSRVLDGVYSGHFFVTSEKRHDAPRRYTVRCCDAAGRIDTVGAFDRYASAQAARTVARRLTWLTFSAGDKPSTAPLHIQTVQEDYDHLPFLLALCSEAWEAGRTWRREHIEAMDCDRNVDNAGHAWYDAARGDRETAKTALVYGLVDCFKMGAYGTHNPAQVP